MTLLDRLRRRFAPPPERVRAAVMDPDERVLAWAVLARAEGWLVATSRGLRVVPGGFLPWHEIGQARWEATADGGGSFAITALREVEPGVQERVPVRQHVVSDAGDLPGVLRRRVDQTVVASRRHPLPGGGGVLLVARRVPGSAAREWTVVFDAEADRSDRAAREFAREKLADVVAADSATD